MKGKKIEIMPLLDKPVWQLSGREFAALMRNTLMEMETAKEEEPRTRRFVFGLDGICDLFGCSKSTAERIKKSGIIDAAITQVKRKIVVDAEHALQLFGNKMKDAALDGVEDSSENDQGMPPMLEIPPSHRSTNQGRAGR